MKTTVETAFGQPVVIFTDPDKTYRVINGRVVEQKIPGRSPDLGRENYYWRTVRNADLRTYLIAEYRRVLKEQPS